jgi:hypothetical protein
VLGTYIYKASNNKGYDGFLTIEQKSRGESPVGDPCSSDINTFLYFRDFGRWLSKSGVTESSRCGFYNGRISIEVEDGDRVSTNLGSFESVRVNTTQEYFVSTANHSDPHGSIETSEWYVCGYGLVRSTRSWTDIYQSGSSLRQSEQELLSFTPITTNEARVRYILLDIELADVEDDYRANIINEETAEALRRWSGGIRVINSDKFERIAIDDRWALVYAGTETPIDGKEVILNSD